MQHDHLGRTVGTRGVRARHGTRNMSLGDLAKRGVGVLDGLVSVEAVALEGVGCLGGTVPRWQVGRGGDRGRQGA